MEFSKNNARVYTHLEKCYPAATVEEKFTFSVCEQAEVAYPYIAGRQDMKQEPSDELLRLEAHSLLAVLVCIIPP